MKPNPFLRSSLRQVWRALLFLLLIGGVTFSAVTQFYQHLIVRRETERLGKSYRSIASLSPIDPFEDSKLEEAANLLASRADVACEDRRKLYSAFLADYDNADVDGLRAMSSVIYVVRDINQYADPVNAMRLSQNKRPVFSNDVIFCGVLSGKVAERGMSYKSEYLREKRSGKSDGYLLRFKVDTPIAGYPEYAEKSDEITIRLLPDLLDHCQDLAENFQVGRRYLLRAYFGSFSGTETWQFAKDNLFFRPLIGERDFLELAQGEDVDLTRPELTGLPEELLLLKEQMRSVELCTTRDMTAIPDYQPRQNGFYLVEGRYLNWEDETTTGMFCVVDSQFAELRGLHEGDELRLRVENFQSAIPGGYVYSEEDNRTLLAKSGEERNYRIVGIVRRPEGSLTSMVNRIMVPESTIPASFLQGKKWGDPADYSFVLKHSEGQSAFLAVMEKPLADLGFTLNFVDSYAENYWNSVRPLQRSAAMNFGLNLLLLLLIFMLLVFLELRQRGRDYAVARAQGMRRATANRRLTLPFILTGIPGIVIGSLLAWPYARQLAEKTLSKMENPAGLRASVELPLFYLPLVALGLIGALLLLQSVGIYRLSRRPVLGLLQQKDGQSARKAAKKTTKERQAEQARARELKSRGIRALSQTLVRFVPAELEEALRQSRESEGEARRTRPFSLGGRYLRKHWLRNGLKTALLLGLAALFILACGWMQWVIGENRQEIDRLYLSRRASIEILPVTVTTAHSKCAIHKKTIEKFEKKEYLTEAYFIGGTLREFLYPVREGRIVQEMAEKFVNLNGVMVDAYFARQKAGYTIRFAPDWDLQRLSQAWNQAEPASKGAPALLSEAMAARLGVQVGDSLAAVSEVSDLRLHLVGIYDGLEGLDKDALLLSLDTLKKLDSRSLHYSVANWTVDPRYNRELPTIRAELDAIIEEGDSAYVPIRAFVRDEELRQVIEPLEKNLSLLSLIYPLTVAISLLVAAGLSLLFLLQRAKEVAIQRVLGLRPVWIRGLLAGDILFLSLLGLALGTALLLTLLSLPVDLRMNLLYLVLAYLGASLIGMIPALRQLGRLQPLELLQVKE